MEIDFRTILLYHHSPPIVVSLIRSFPFFKPNTKRVYLSKCQNAKYGKWKMKTPQLFLKPIAKYFTTLVAMRATNNGSDHVQKENVHGCKFQILEI